MDVLIQLYKKHREVVNYLELAKSINNTSEVNQLIDSVKYVYISEE